VEQKPSPGDHEVAGDLCWDENKKTLMFPKGKTWPYAPRGMETVQTMVVAIADYDCIQRMPT